jgi:glycosyltransferase involved in cell wall biosynthesis
MKVFVTGTRGIPHVMGGVEVHCEALMPRLARMGFDITVVRRSGYVQDSEVVGEWEGVRLLDVPSPRRKSLEAIIHTVRAVWAAKRAGADVVHIHAIGPALAVPLARLLGLKVVFTHHGFDYERAKWGRAARWALRLGERFGCKMANRVIVIAEVIRQRVEKTFGRHDLVLIPNGAPRAVPTTDSALFERLGLRDRGYVLTTCRFVPEKNLHHLVAAWKLLRQDVAAVREGRIRLVLAGDADFKDDYSEELKAMARREDVVLPGRLSGAPLWALLSGARGFVLPSSHEGLPISLLEAMAYGLPVAVSDIAPNLEVGLSPECYFPVGDVPALAERLKAMLAEGSPERLDYDMGRYDWDRIAAQTAEVYRSLDTHGAGTPAGKDG